MIEEGLDLGQDPFDVLVPHRRVDAGDPAESEGGFDGLAQRRRTRGVVGGVHDDRGRVAHDLHASWAGGVHEALLDDAAIQAPSPHEGFDGDEGGRRVVRLVLAEEGHKDILVEGGGGADGDHLAADTHLALHDLEVPALDARDGVHGPGLLEENVEDFLLLLHDDDDLAGFDDAGLLPSDVANRGSEPPGVVQGDGGDDGDSCVDDVGGVPSPTHSDLDDGGVDRVVREGRVGHDREDLEEGQAGASLLSAAFVDHGDVRRDVLPGAHEALAGDRVALE